MGLLERYWYWYYANAFCGLNSLKSNRGRKKRYVNLHFLIIEESLLHVFHALFHKVWAAISDEKNPVKYSRTYELFFYTHQQFIRRAATEREIGKVLKKKGKPEIFHNFTTYYCFLNLPTAGLPEFKPLDPPALREPLGPGYTAGWWVVGWLGGGTVLGFISVLQVRLG